MKKNGPLSSWNAVVRKMHNPGGGMYWAFEVMDVEDITNMLHAMKPERFRVEEKVKR